LKILDVHSDSVVPRLHPEEVVNLLLHSENGKIDGVETTSLVLQMRFDRRICRPQSRYFFNARKIHNLEGISAISPGSRSASGVL
jgi:hypothetical protein